MVLVELIACQEDFFLERPCQGDLYLFFMDLQKILNVGAWAISFTVGATPRR
jgi:hypothetical protein